MKSIFALLICLVELISFGQTNGFLSWGPINTTDYSVSIYKGTNLQMPALTWPLYFQVSNTNRIVIPFDGSLGFFYGTFYKTNYNVSTNQTTSTNVTTTNIFSYTTNSFSHVTLAWDPSADTSVSGYKVYYGIASRNYTNSVSVGNATTKDVSNLVARTSYYFAATANDTNGIESDYSSEVSTYTTTITTNISTQTNTVVVTNYFLTTNFAGISSSNLMLTLQAIMPIPSPSVITNTFAFTNISFLTVRDTNTASSYPWSISVTGLTGVVDKVTVRIRGITHTFLSDIDAMLSGPSNQTVIVMSDVGFNQSVTNMVLAFDDSATSKIASNSIPAITNGIYKPSNYSEAWQVNDTWVTPAPAQNTTNTFAIFNNKNPNGIWSLWVVDDGPSDTGSIASWELYIRMVQGTGTNPPPQMRVRKSSKIILPPLPPITTLPPDIRKK